MKSNSKMGRLKLSLVDAMAFIAATALGLASVSLIPGMMDPGIFMIYQHGGQYPLVVATITLLVWTLTPLMLGHTRRPKLTTHRTEEPGFVACVSVAVTIPILVVAHVGYGLALLLKRQYLELYVWILGPILASASYSGIGVAGAWITLAVAGRWKSVMSWSDLWGRILGIIWIILSMTAKSIELLFYL
jgi:hypothetical protein